MELSTGSLMVMLRLLLGEGFWRGDTDRRLKSVEATGGVPLLARRYGEDVAADGLRLRLRPLAPLDGADRLLAPFVVGPPDGDTAGAATDFLVTGGDLLFGTEIDHNIMYNATSLSLLGVSVFLFYFLDSRTAMRGLF